MKKFISVLLLTVVLFSFCACSPAKETAPVNLKNGETVQLLANDVYDKLGTDATINWSSSDETVVKVDDGKITYVSEGNAKITASGTSADGKKTYTTEFNVKCLNPDGAVKLDKYSVRLNDDGESVTLTATLTDETDRIKKWSSSDESVAIVADGKITRVSNGKAEIKVVTSLGYEATCYVMCDSVVMKLGDVEITDAMYAYWLASYKTQWIEYYIGEDTPEVWATVIDAEGATLESMFMETTHDSIVQMLEAVYVYYEENDSVSDEITTEVDKQIAEAVETNGGEEALNKILSGFYADIDLLRQIFIFEDITNHVYNDMFGENGTSKITDENIKEYFYENYMKAQHVFFDLNYKFDEEGNYSYLTSDEQEEKRTLADNVWTEIQNGKLDYDKAVKQYSDDTEDTYEGFVFAADDYDATFTECVAGMEIGHLKNLETSYGIHLIKRLELSDEDIDDDIKEIIEQMLTMQFFDEKLSEYGADIVISVSLDDYDIVNMPLFSSIEE